MFAKKIYFLTILLFLIELLGSSSPGGLEGQVLGQQDEQTLYFRKSGSKRYLDPAPGEQLVNDNISSFLYFWGDYVVESPFVLNDFGLELHLDATIVSASAESRIKVALTRNGKTIFTSEVYSLPAGPAGPRQINIVTEETLYPGVTYNQGDDLSFYFQQVLNLNPCQFRYNGTGGRDDSHLVIHLGPPDYPVMELSPAVVDVSLEAGGSMDTLFSITNRGFKRLHCDLSLPQGQKTLFYGELDSPSELWVISDQDLQDFYNVRFTPAQRCTLRSALMLFSTEGSAGNPDLMVYVWDDSSGFPGAKLDSILIPNSSLSYHPNWQLVNFSGNGLPMRAHEDFHIGYTAISHSSGDALAIYSDDGLPVGNERRSSGKWDENWRTMYDKYDLDANFFIRATVKYGDPPGWLSHGSPPGSLPPYDTHDIQLSVHAAGLNDGVYKSGVIIENDSPDPSVILPVILRVGQTGVDGDENGRHPESHALIGSYPNPFNAITRIRYRLGSMDGELLPVRLVIYNTLGQRVRELAGGFQPPGSYDLWWDGRDDAGTRVASGIYLCRLQVGAFQEIRKMVLMK